MSDTSRRGFLSLAGSTTVVALAGCSGRSDNDDEASMDDDSMADDSMDDDAMGEESMNNETMADDPMEEASGDDDG